MLDGRTQRNALEHVYWLATMSPDNSSQNAAMIFDETWSDPLVGTVNAFPRWVRESAERWERPAKYQFVEHAERAAIYQAAKRGIPTKGRSMVCAWAACADCARSIVGAGIRTLVRHNPEHAPNHDAWLESIAIGDTIMREGGVEIIDYIHPLPGAPKILRNGELWQP